MENSYGKLCMVINLFEGLGSEPWIPGPHSFTKPCVLKATVNDPMNLTRCILTKQCHKGKLLSDWNLPTRCLVLLAHSMGAPGEEIHAKSIFIAWATSLECWTSLEAWLSFWMRFLMKV